MRKQQNRPPDEIMNSIIDENNFFWQYFVVGAPAFLSYNINGELALVNGAPVSLHSITFATIEEQSRVDKLISGDDAIDAAKTIRSVTKEFKGSTFVVKGGYFDGDVLDAKQLDKVADLPSKEELLTTLLRTIQEGPRQVIGVIQGPARDLVNLLKNYENKLSEE